MTDETRVGRWNMRRTAATMLICLAASLVSSTASVEAQGWWPWANQQEPPRPREPINRGPPPAPIPLPGQQPGFRPAPGASGNICLQLEQRLVSEGQQRGVNPRETMARLENEMRQTERQLSQAQGQLDRGDCYEYFLFSKSLRNTAQCRTSAGTTEQLRRRVSELDAQRLQLAGAGERRVSDDIVRELARNGCGPQYVQEARKLDAQGGSNPFWSAEEEGGPKGSGNQFGSLPFATYRTICVRLCDGYYFPVSFSTLPNHFQRDADVCQSKCAAPVELYYHQNPGANVDQAVSIKAQSNYTALKTAFRYRKEFVHGCSCKEAEYQAGAGERRADAAPASSGPVQAAGPLRQKAQPQ
jgi:Protein of unknown function (DUF2865)